MSWAVVEHKISFLRSALNEWERQSLEREFAELTNSSPRFTKLSRSARGILFVDLAYAIIRHRDWLQTPVFNALLVEFLQLDHGVPKCEAEVLIHDLISAAEQLGLGRPRTICNDDREFLTWAYVCAAGAADDDILEADLGLGTSLLRRLRDGISALERVDQSVFVPEYDAMLATIVMELAHESKATPWSMDIHRLKFLLLNASGDVAQPYVLEESLPRIYEGLIAIGCGEFGHFEDRPSLSEVLISAGIMRENHQARRKKGSSGHILTDFGYRLTALKAALDVFVLSQPDDFLCLNARWQLAFVRGSDKFDPEIFADILSTHLRAMSPEVVEAIMVRIYSEGDTSALSGARIAEYLRQCEFGWHKAAIFRALRAMRPTRALLEVVATELSESMSPGIRMAASSLLDSWTEANGTQVTH
jgi:hypothetical protein